MNYTKRIVCLANSRKTSGRCIAGKEIVDRAVAGWIRPVSARDNHEISEDDRMYEDGTTAQVMDVIDIDFKSKAEHPFQTENHLIDDKLYWRKASTCSHSSLAKCLDSPSTLWDRLNSSYSGLNDRMDETIASQTDCSLYFISPEELIILVRTEGEEFDNAKKKVRARFTYNGIQHLISVTDPLVERAYYAKGLGEYPQQGEVYMTVSLGEPWNRYCYILAAGIFGSLQ